MGSPPMSGSTRNRFHDATRARANARAGSTVRSKKHARRRSRRNASFHRVMPWLVLACIGLVALATAPLWLVRPNNTRPPGTGVLIGGVDGTRIDQQLAEYRTHGAYSEQNRSFLDWVWAGARQESVTFTLPDPLNPSGNLRYSADFRLGHDDSRLLTLLNVWSLERNPLDTPNGTNGVAAALYVDPDGLSPLTPPAAGMRITHLLGYGSVEDTMMFSSGAWQAYTGQDPSGHVDTGYAVSDGHNTTYLFSIPLRSPNLTISALNVPPRSLWSLGVSICLTFNGPYEPSAMPRSCWPNDGSGGNPDGSLTSSQFFAVRVQT